MDNNAIKSAKRANRNVHYVLLAEFDIDKGSCLKIQYPSPIGLQVNLLSWQPAQNQLVIIFIV